MTSTRLHPLILTVIAVLLCGTSIGQVAIGTPRFGSFGGGPFDTVNLGNLNVHFAIPVVHKVGRGLPFDYDLKNDTSVWYPVGVSGSQTWTPVGNWGWRGWTESSMGYVSYQHGSTKCPPNWTQVEPVVNTYVYHDPWGISHPFPISFKCLDGTYGGAATDGSGYFALYPNTITTPSGHTIYPPQNSPVGDGSHTDPNGNYFTVSGNVFTDTLGTTALTISGTNPVNFTYTSPANTQVSVAMHYTTYTVKTNFGCSGIAEYGPTSASLVSSVSLPDGSQYTFQYEATPGFAGDFTGRISSVTLPTGGTISYTYTGANNGITCADGSAAGLTRTLSPGGTWTYARTDVSGNHWQTTVTDPTTPTHNQTVIDFQEDSSSNNFYETQRVAYQGAAPTTPLQTQIVCYNAPAGPVTPTACPTAVIASPISRRTAFSYAPNAAGKQAETDVSYNTSGLVTEVDEYNFGIGNGAVGALTRKTVTSYAVFDKPASVIVYDGSSNVVSQTNYTYDESTPTPTTGTPQHSAATGARGNPTTVASKVNASQTLYHRFSYYDTGTLNTITGASLSSTTNGPLTTYVYGTGSCGNSFATQVNGPLSLSSSMTWNCTGGVELSATDANGNVVSTTYSDPYFWRSAKATDQLNNDATMTYAGPTTAETALTLNSGLSTVDARAKVDGFGRPIVSQGLQLPGGSTYDSAETDYDAVGRVAKATQAYAASADSLCTGTCPSSTFAYDALGRPTTAADAGGGTVTTSYTLNDVLQTVGPAPTGENAKSKQFEYDALGRLSSVCEVTSASGSGACGQSSSQTGYLTKYSYNLLGLTGVTQNAQPGSSGQQTRTYAFDMLGRMTSEINPEQSGTTSYVYDTDATCGTSAGDLVKRTDAANNVTCYTYDQLYRVLSVTYPSGTYSASTVKKYFIYDAATVNGTAITNAKGRLAEAYTCTTCSPLTKLTDLWYSYSKRGEITDSYETTPHSGATPYHVTQSYWAHGVPNALSGIPGVPTVYYGASDGSGLDGEGRITKVTVSGTGPALVTGVNYTNSGTTQPIGSLTEVTFGSLDNDNFSYDTQTGRMTQYQFKVGATPQTDTGALTWNANGSLKTTVITDQLNSAENQTCNYGYDDVPRLASANCGTAWNQTFGFDPFGNISKTATAGTSFQATYSGATNRLTQVGTLVPTYDPNGNLTYDTAHTYTWDAEGKMLSADGTAVTLTYDALGRMIEQARGSSFTEILYGPGGKMALMTGQALQKAFVPLPGGATAVYNSSGLAYYRHSDGLGSSRLATTPGRTKYFDVAYAPFGENYSGSGTTDLSFTGQNQDTTSWLHDFTYREYNPVQGRWISPDPAGVTAVNMGNPQSWNRYAYVQNNPLINVDPLGLDCLYLFEDNTLDYIRPGDCYSSTDDGIFIDQSGIQQDSLTVSADANSVFYTYIDPNDPNHAGSGVWENISPLPTASDNADFLAGWALGVLPSSISYGPNDGMTRQLANTATFNQLRQIYKQQGCPNTGKAINGGDHFTPFAEGFGTGNQALMQVGGFSAYGSTSGNVTTFTIKNVAGQASFSGATTLGPTGARIVPFAAGIINPYLGLAVSSLSAHGVHDNPYGANGPFHNITQTFTWMETNLCK